MSRQLLMIRQYAFKDGWAGTTHRFFHIAESLRAHGWETTVLEASYRYRFGPPPPADRFPGRVVQTRRNGLWLNLHGLGRAYWGLVDLGGRFKDPERGWGWRAAEWYPRQPSFVRPDAVWGVSCGELAGAVGARIIAERLSVPYVLEFRDPCPPVERELTRHEEPSLRACLDAASLVVTTTQALADHMEGMHGACRGKARAVRHYYDDSVPPALSEREPGAPLALLHAGYLRGGTGRNADCVVRAIARAAELEPASRGQIELRLIGSGRGIDQAVALAGELGISDAVTAGGQVSAERATEMMDSADVLVLLKYPDHEHNLQIPGKTYHYMGRARPILGIMYECEAATIIRDSGLGFTYPHEDVDGIARQLVDLWQRRDDLGSLARPNWDGIRQYTQSAMGARIHDLLMQIMPSTV